MSKGQLNTKAAEIYEEFFIPALFAEWPPHLIKAAQIKGGDIVLDVACGTGVLARAVQDVVGQSGKVIGLDPNEGMLAVAQKMNSTIDWKTGVAEEIPFDSGFFDAVVSQFGLMFFVDRKKAIQEMLRVVKPGGRVSIAVWGGLEITPGYNAMVKLLHRLFGEEIANEIKAPFCLGNISELESIFKDAGCEKIEIQTITGSAKFNSLDDWVHTDIKGWTLADKINDDQYVLLQKEAQNELKEFVQKDNTVFFDSPAHIVTCIK